MGKFKLLLALGLSVVVFTSCNANAGGDKSLSRVSVNNNSVAAEVKLEQPEVKQQAAASQPVQASQAVVKPVVNKTSTTPKVTKATPKPAAKPESKPVSASSSSILVSDPGSLMVVVNRIRRLPDNWKPNDLVTVSVPYKGRSEARYMRKEASDALSKLFAGAKEDGINLYAVSGFRSYSLQKVVFAKNVSQVGLKKAEVVSASPGHSEHQTGLAMDISSAALNYSLKQSFGNTTEGKWLKAHAAEYGFIIRYLPGKESITGYIYEPWHVRYVGTKAAKDIMSRGITLEQYEGL